VGDHDPVKAALTDKGIDFTPVAMQPGKPQGVGRVGGTAVVCLPGNPVAVAVCVELFVGAAVRAMLGVPEPSWHAGVAVQGWRCPPGREQLMPVIVDADGNGPATVRPATSGGSGSHLAGRLATATALARVGADVAAIETGDTVLFRRFTA